MERMRRLDRPVVVTIAFAVLITAMAGALRQVASNTGCIQLVVVSSQEKSLLMGQAALQFEATRPLVGDRCVSVLVEAVVSGAAEQALVKDWAQQPGPTPDVWIPSASTWLNLLEAQRTEQHAEPLLVPGTTPTSLMQSPLVIAMPEPMATALGWPKKNIGWKTIFDLAQDRRGWALYSHAEWGPFRLGKTNPYRSTSGLNTLISTYYAASGKTTSLTSGDLTKKEVISYVKGVESSVAHYGDTATTFLTNLLAAEQNSRTPYVSAVAVEEKEVWNYNVGNLKGDPLFNQGLPPREKLIAIYPSDGTILADHPYALLKWATPDKKEASDAFLHFLLSDKVQRDFQAAGFRNREGQGLSDQISVANGLSPDGAKVVTLPTGQVIAAIQASWNALRKRARVLMVVDVSHSAGAGSLAAIKTPLADALGSLTSDDQIGLWQAPGATSPVDELVHVGSLAATQPQMDAKIQSMAIAGGEASLVNLLEQSVDELHGAYDSSRIDAIVLLSPGTGASPSELNDLLRFLRNQPPDQSIHIFTVSYGANPATGPMLRIALASGGGFYSTASAATFNDLMIQVLSNF